MIRPARTADIEAMTAVLDARIETSMFLRGNLERGIRGFWVVGEPPGSIIQLTERGFLLIQADVIEARDWGRLRHRLAGRACLGVNGEPSQVAAALAGLGLDRRKAGLDRVEPLFSLDLGRLTVPPGESLLRAPAAADVELLAAWRSAYLEEAMHMEPGEGLARAARSDVERLIGEGRCRILEDGAGPLAMTAFNAVAPQAVQVGSVFTPPEARGRGHARRAVALHLAEARDAGHLRAVLFAASSAAVRAYQAIGFARIGDYRIVLFPAPCLIGS